MDESIHQLIVTNARLETHLEEVRDDKIRTEQSLLKEIGLLQLRLANAEAERALWQGRYEGAVKGSEELKQEADYQQGRAATFEWWLKDSQKRNRDLHLRLMEAHIEIAALKDGIDALAAELEVWYWH